MKRPTSELSKLKYIKNVAHAIEFLGMSVAEFSEAMPSQWKTRKHISPQLVCDWKRGYRKPSGTKTDSRMSTQLDYIARLIAQKLTARYRREIGVSITVNSPWRVTAWARCNSCGKYFEIRRHTDKCQKCKR